MPITMAEKEDIDAICAVAASEDKSELERRIAELAERLPDVPEAALAQFGAAGALLRIELIRRKHDLRAFVEALLALPAEAGPSDSASSPLAALVLANAREHGMREWGHGRIDN